MTDVLIVDDERTVRFGIKKALRKLNLEVQEVESGPQALEALQTIQPGLVLMDMNMPGLSGLETLDQIVKDPDPPLVVMVTAYGSERLAVESMKRGAYDYLTKPYDVDELRLVVGKALRAKNLERENAQLKDHLARLTGEGRTLLGQSEGFLSVWRRVQKAAPTDVTVLITGESGTGKELLAREIHRLSSRVEKPFVSINCAAIPEDLIESELFGHEKGAFTGATESRAGKFELADGGTLFLDEIGDMSLTTQAKVLRALQERTIQRIGSSQEQAVDVRVLSATHQDLAQQIQEGAFREDLYYRLKVIEIHIPPLRERAEDIPLLAEHFLEQVCAKHEIPVKRLHPDLLRALGQAPWKGNVRQLRNQMEASVVLSDSEELTLEDFEGLAQFAGEQEADEELPALDFSLSFREAKKRFVESFERRYLTATLEHCEGNISKAARILDMHRQSLQQKLKSLEIST